MNNQLDPLAHAKDTLLDLAVRFGPKLLAAMLIMTVGFFVAGWIARATGRGLHRLDLEPPVRQLLTRVARVLVIVLFTIMALQNLGVELLPLIAGWRRRRRHRTGNPGRVEQHGRGAHHHFTKPYRVGEYIAIVASRVRWTPSRCSIPALIHPDRSRSSFQTARWW